MAESTLFWLLMEFCIWGEELNKVDDGGVRWRDGGGW